MPAGRPKSEATRIKELESRIKYLENELSRAAHVANEAREKPIKMGALFFDIWVLAQHINEKFFETDEGLLMAQLKAIECMADRGAEMDA